MTDSTGPWGSETEYGAPATNEGNRIFGLAAIAGAVSLCAIILTTVLPGGAFAAQPTASDNTTVSPKVHQLATQLAEEWLKEQGMTTPAAVPPPQQTVNSIADGVNSDLGAVHDQILALAGAIPVLPLEFEGAVHRITAIDADAGNGQVLLDLGVLGDPYMVATRRLAAETQVLLNLTLFGAIGFGAQWLFRKTTRRLRGRLDGLPMETVKDRLRVIAVRFVLAFGVIGAFVIGSLAPLLILDMDPVRREILLSLLIVLAAIWLAVATGDFLFAPDNERFRILPTDTVAARFWCRRLVAFAGWFALVWVIIQECDSLGFSFEGIQLVGYTLGLGIVAIALEAVWRRPIGRNAVTEAALGETHRFGRGAANIAVSIGVVMMWVCWVAAPGVLGVLPAFWLILVLIILPPAISASRRAVEHLLRPAGSFQTGGPPSVVEATLEHGIRALLIIGAAAVLAWGWDVDLVHLAGRGTFFASIVHGVLTTVVILLIADVVWHAAKAAIDKKLAETVDLGQPNSEEARRRARLRTLLPIFRNVLFVLVIAVAVMMALAEMGVEIGPLIAGASVVGVAIGFGAQTFVRDVIAGMFYLLDDAFRVGEYIQAGHYKGTVEGFSIRSIKLRHHRGPVFTVPFSLLGAVENMSRDWVIDKIAIGITYDSDLNLAKKLIKQIGLDLAKDPEYAPLILEPLKMQGVDQLGDFAVQIRAKMMTLPGEQFVIRRQAHAMIKKAFDENGIKFAFPTVQIAGEGEAATAAAARRALELTQPVAAE
jgi:moderate conductance mechanosensitive channel